jgi:hypothetical protein
MSYDLYCYRSVSGVPDVGEAQAIVEAINAAEEAGDSKPTFSQTRERITAALIEHNPRLEQFKFDYTKIAESQKLSEDEARLRYQHAELNPPEGDLAIQLTVHDDHVFISIPYWYRGAEANQVFLQCSDYLRVIRRTAGFFAYDPQTDIAFDPENTELRDHQRYEEVVRELPKIATEASKAKKPWWKFW